MKVGALILGAGVGDIPSVAFSYGADTAYVSMTAPWRSIRPMGMLALPQRWQRSTSLP